MKKRLESKQLAGRIQDALSSRLQLVSTAKANRGVKQAPFIVLTGAKMPSILSEISFVSNARDESLLLEGAQRQRVAEGLYSGDRRYLDSLTARPTGRIHSSAKIGSAFPARGTSTLALLLKPRRRITSAISTLVILLRGFSSSASVEVPLAGNALPIFADE